MPSSDSGEGPAPAVMVVVPIRLAAPHVPREAAGAPQGVTPPREARIPSGSFVVMPERICSPSARVNSRVRFVLAPACRLDGVADPAGANVAGAAQAPPDPLASTVKELDGVDAAAPDQGARIDVVAAAPQASGFAKRAPAPVLKLSLRSENGTCGLPEKVLVSRPVTGSAVTVPVSLTATPAVAFSASMKTR